MTRAPVQARQSFAVLAVGAGLFLMTQSLVSPALPAIQRDLATTQGGVTWMLTAWLVAAVVATPVVGRAGDLFGKRRALVVVLAGVAVGCLGAAVAPNIGVLVASRALQGLGGAVLPLSFGIIRDEFPASRVPTAIGAISAATSVGGAAGTTLAGPIAESLGWRWSFWLAAFVAIGTAVATRHVVPESAVRAPGRLPWLDALLLAGGLVALLLPVSQRSEWGWSSAALPLLALWALVASRTPDPVIDLRLLVLPGVRTANLVAFLVGVEQYSALAFLPQFAQTSAGYGIGVSATEAGLLLLPLLAAMALGGLASGPLTHTIGVRGQLVFGSAAGAAAFAALMWWHARAWQVATAAGVLGLGLGVLYATTTALVVRAVPADRTGVAGGVNSNFRNLGGAIGLAVLSAIVTAGARPGSPPPESGYTTGFAVLSLVCLVTVGVCLRANTSYMPAPSR